MSANFGGKGSCAQSVHGERCPVCGGYEVLYLGSDVLHGNPYSPASDTDVDHNYRCTNPSCGHEWSCSV